MARLEDAAIAAPAEMLDEGAEEATVGDADGVVTVEQHFHGTHAPRSGSSGSRLL
jgi:hypothetical protein